MNANGLGNAKYYLSLFLRRPLTAVIPALLAAGVGGAIVFAMPRSYYAEALVVLEPHQIPSTLVASTVAGEQLQSLEQRVLARENLLALANRFNLFPADRARMSDTQLSELIRKHIVFRTLSSGPTGEDPTSATSATFNIGFEGGSPQLAADVAKALVDMMIEENRQSRTSQASETAQFLNREVGDLTTRLETREADWAKYVRDNQDLLPTRLPGYLTEIQVKQASLAALDKETSDLDEQLKLLEVQISTPALSAASASRETELSNLKAQLAQKSSIYSEEHPEVRALKSQIQVLQAALAQAGQAGASPDDQLTADQKLTAEKLKLGQARLADLMRQRDQAAERVAWLQTAVTRIPPVEAELSVLQRNKESTQRDLDEMRSKLETARVGERLEQNQYDAQIQVVDEPEVPRYANGAGRTKMMVGVLAVAALVGCAALYASDLFDRAIRGTFDLAQSLKGQSLVVIPYWRTRSERRLRAAVVAISAIVLLACVTGAFYASLKFELAPWSRLSSLLLSENASSAISVQG